MLRPAWCASTRRPRGSAAARGRGWSFVDEAGKRGSPPVPLLNNAVKQVSEHLGNTPTVARSSSIDPRVLDRFEDGRTVLPALRRLENTAAVPDLADDATRAAVERAVVRLLRS